MFYGSFTALVTPMHEDGRIDDEAYIRLIDWQIAEGTNGIVPVGTTGESPTLSHEEHKQVVDLAVKAAKGRVPVMAGAGSNSTAEAIGLARYAEKAGADAVLVVTPYYNKPTQEGLYRHFKAVAEAVSIPLLIYNIPGRSVIDMSVETMARLAEIKNIVGVKDATANLARPLHTTRACGEVFIQLSGEDHTALAYLASGGHGCISVTSNVAPKLCADMQAAWTKGDVKTAMAIQQRLVPLHDAMFCESNPGPVKYAASLLGFGANHVRLPLAPVSAASAERVKAAMRDVGLLN
ncbi:4-hydroxy-tetrahydrodipicolinate synthase [Acidocella aminolytica]|uniref:4-hydroxy-tetrahydrodipicolinate synthase n=1 Tax=Acidocella aminolytica 101 = DSM 11237 TaxID=1120923 RepID=A0A0D6PJ76_9PROT|nr:4-hydroxy-tetrahydrodipicolinate synthase [Acidocella aminolytica]GAN81795.1 dihydrodipicolinate synthase [Acidocella aminolytica 101 = DSM 11237]GBQ35131.1 dihydrodipicolinate synthase [Acidocella aminolytica 101 = DSM 11237]SHE80959.1 dihydrodipicolinate synthase [Acidocella aminolytica 101 = DSM 11237]